MNEATVTMSASELTDLLVEIAELDDGRKKHAILRSPSGETLAVYVDDDGPAPLQKGLDWWLGPAILLAVILMIIGAFTVATGFIGLLF